MMRITFVQEPLRHEPLPNQAPANRHDPFVEAVARHAGVTIPRIDGYLRDVLPRDGCILLESTFDPTRRAVSGWGVVALMAVAACGRTDESAGGGDESWVPVALARVDAAHLRAITESKAYVVIDARGAIRWTRKRSEVAAGEPLGSGQLLFSLIEGEKSAQKSGAFVEYDHDSYATLSDETSAFAVVVADAATPAQITVRRGIQSSGSRPVVLAAGAVDTAVPYEFGAEPWENWKQEADLTLRVDQLDLLRGQSPRTVMLQFTDATTTGQLIDALVAVARAGAEKVRLHRMMGWGAIGPAEIVSVRGPTADDDVITPGEPAVVTIAEPQVDGEADPRTLHNALLGARPRLRYCYEKGEAERPGAVELAFDVSSDGAIANASGRGLGSAIESCIAGAIFDLEIAPIAVAGPAHAVVSITFSRGPETQLAPVAEVSGEGSGFWCWIHEDGTAGICGRRKIECESFLYGFNEVTTGLGTEPASTRSCVFQKVAWQGTFARPDRFKPTKALCRKGLGKCESCRRMR